MVSFYEDYAFDPLPEELVGSLYGELATTSVVPTQQSTFAPSPTFSTDSDDFLSSFSDTDDIIEHLLSSDSVGDFPQQVQPQQQQQLPFQFQYHVEQVGSPNSLFFSSPSWNSAPSPASSLSPASSPSSSVPSSPFSLSPFLSAPTSPAYWVPLSPNSNLMYSAPSSFPPSYSPALLKGPLTSNDCALCDIIPAKKVSVTVQGKPLITTTLKDFYGERIREESITNKLLLDAHPQFTSHDDAVGSIYILRNVSARKPPQIAKKAFNCHTRKEAGLAHWQYNVPGTDFTCRVSEWVVDGVMHNSYHYYRSPLARPNRRVKPY